jgi:hypothetical protein
MPKCHACGEKGFSDELFVSNRETLCQECFQKKYGQFVLVHRKENDDPPSRYGKYHGGHKAFGTSRDDSGIFYLTKNHLFFVRDSVFDPNERWVIRVPLDKVKVPEWNLSKEEKGKKLDGLGGSGKSLLGGPFSTKPKRIVLPYVDDNGRLEQPAFSFQDMHEWSSTIYDLLVQINKKEQQEEKPSKETPVNQPIKEPLPNKSIQENLPSKPIKESLPEKEQTSMKNEDIFEKLKKLAELRDQGILTDEEFQSKKKEWLKKL